VPVNAGTTGAFAVPVSMTATMTFCPVFRPPAPAALIRRLLKL
jgi:hypothetical protein